MIDLPPSWGCGCTPQDKCKWCKEKQKILEEERLGEKGKKPEKPTGISLAQFRIFERP